MPTFLELFYYILVAWTLFICFLAVKKCCFKKKLHEKIITLKEQISIQYEIIEELKKQNITLRSLIPYEDLIKISAKDRELVAKLVKLRKLEKSLNND